LTERFDLAGLAMAATIVIWAANNIIVKSTVDTVAPLPYVFCRFLFVVLIVFGWYALRGSIPRIPREDLKWFLLTGLSGYAIYNALFTAALKHTTAFSSAVMISISPLLTSAIAAALKIERARWIQWAGLFVSSAGIGLFVWDKLRENDPTRGDMLGLVAALSFAIYSLATRPIVQRHGSLMVSAWSTLIGLIMIVPFVIPSLIDQDWGAVGVRGWGAMLYSAAISMLLGYTIWGWAIERTSVARTVPFLYFIPVLSGVLSYLFLDETFTTLKIGAALIVFAGVIVARGGAIPRRRSAMESTDASEVPSIKRDLITVRE
jgi:drug/metabolite transporter (DMT)-like permease